MFLTENVTVTPNANEIRDYKYVSKEELQDMFQDPGTKVRFTRLANLTSCLVTANSFTPWFKLIARDFLFGWWDELYNRKNSDGHVVAKSLAGVADGSKVIKM